MSSWFGNWGGCDESEDRRDELPPVTQRDRQLIDKTRIVYGTRKEDRYIDEGNARSFDDYKEKALLTEDRPWQIEDEAARKERKQPAAAAVTSKKSGTKKSVRTSVKQPPVAVEEATQKRMMASDAEQVLAGLVQETSLTEDARLIQEMRMGATKLPAQYPSSEEHVAQESRAVKRRSGVPQSFEPAAEEWKAADSDSEDPATTVEAEEDLDDIDLEFVQQYDNAFNEFIAYNPRFLQANPDLVHSLRVTKLQALLERGQEMQDELMSQLEAIEQSKADMQMQYAVNLKEASRKKAARDIDLRNKMNELNKDTRTMEGTLTWNLVMASEARAKRQYLLLQNTPDATSCSNPHDLLALLPHTSDFQAVRDTATAAVPTNTKHRHKQLSEKQQGELRQCQIDNALFKAEIEVLQKKLAYQKSVSQKLSWVETVLVRADDQIMNKLKRKYQKKIGLMLPP